LLTTNVNVNVPPGATRDTGLAAFTTLMAAARLALRTPGETSESTHGSAAIDMTLPSSTLDD